MTNPFFKNHGPISVSDVLKILNIQIENNKKKIFLNDIKDLYTASNSDITFFHSKNI